MGSLCNLCASDSNYTLDIIVILFCAGMAIYHGNKGFAGCIFALISTAVALLGSVMLARLLIGITGGLFGLDDVFASKFEEIFAKLNGFNVDISAGGWEKALEEGDVSAVLTQLVVKAVADQESLPAGTTVASLLGDSIGPIAVLVIVSAVMFIAVKIALFFIKNVVENIVQNIELMKSVDATIGIIFGLLYALFIVCCILAVLMILPFESISQFMERTWFVGGLYSHNPLITLVSKLF